MKKCIQNAYPATWQQQHLRFYTWYVSLFEEKNLFRPSQPDTEALQDRNKATEFNLNKNMHCLNICS